MSQCKIDKNKKRSLFKLSTYSLQLNLIEILCRFMKYEWMELNANETWETLVSYVEKVLRDFGSNYVINFAQLLSNPHFSLFANHFCPSYHSPNLPTFSCTSNFRIAFNLRVIMLSSETTSKKANTKTKHGKQDDQGK